MALNGHRLSCVAEQKATKVREYILEWTNFTTSQDLRETQILFLFLK